MTTRELGKIQPRLGLFTRTLLCGTALAGICAAPALAQESTAEDVVVVTATGRSENILDVPYNITAVSGEQIEKARIRDSAELLRSVPGVSVVDRGERNGAVVNGVRIRGLNVDSAALGDYAVSAVSTVSTYVNDTPIFANFLLTDIAQVEVLRGPQGTLYGSGALGGTVRYTMNAPEIGEFGGHGQISLSQVDGSDGIGWNGDITLNVPLGDQLAFRGTLARADYPGLTDYVNLYALDANGIPVAPNGVLDPAATYRSQEDADTVDTWFGRASLLMRSPFIVAGESEAALRARLDGSDILAGQPREDRRWVRMDSAGRTRTMKVAPSSSSQLSASSTSFPSKPISTLALPP